MYKKLVKYMHMSLTIRGGFKIVSIEPTFLTTGKCCIGENIINKLKRR